METEGNVKVNEMNVFEISKKIVCDLFHLKNLLGYQEESLKALLENHDCFVCQPTGKGKSIVFQSYPYLKFAVDQVNEETQLNPDIIKQECRYKIIIVSPLIGLMKDQQMYLRNKGFKVCCIGQDESNIADVSWRNFIVIFLSLIFFKHEMPAATVQSTDNHAVPMLLQADNLE